MEVNWPQLLQDYGPFALLPFTLFVIERTAAKRAHDAKLPEKTRDRVYAAAWIMIFVLCGAVVAFWYLNRPGPTEAMMRGRISGLTFQQRLRASGPETANVRVFTYWDPQETDQLFWRTFSAAPLDEQTELVFLIDSSTRDSEETLRFPFRASRKFYGASVELQFRYDTTKKSLLFENSPTGKPEELKGQPIVVARDTLPAGPPNRWLRWFGTVLAQSKPSISAVLANLEADDPLIRLTARKQLASIGPEATAEMDKALANSDSDYRVKLGVIVAANQMSGFRADAFSSLAWCEVWLATRTGDDTIKEQANLLLQKQTTPMSTSSCDYQPPQIIRRKNPVYPAVAKAARIEGLVLLSALVGRDGHVREASSLSGPPLLLPAATEAVKTWIYRPALLKGEPVEERLEIHIRFSLNRGVNLE